MLSGERTQYHASPKVTAYLASLDALTHQKEFNMTNAFHLTLLATAMVGTAAFAAEAPTSAPAADTSVTTAQPQTMKECLAQQKAKDSSVSNADMKKACVDAKATDSKDTAPKSDYSTPKQ
jgi:hypothetical protein